MSSCNYMIIFAIMVKAGACLTWVSSGIDMKIVGQQIPEGTKKLVGIIINVHNISLNHLFQSLRLHLGQALPNLAKGCLFGKSASNRLEREVSGYLRIDLLSRCHSSGRPPKY